MFVFAAHLLASSPAIGAAGDDLSIEIWNHNFYRTWSRYDRPVHELSVSRTWVWGPEPISSGLVEPYVDAEGGQRVVQYFDKSRMELTSDPTVPQSDPWHITNGLLAKELITGHLQTGIDKFEPQAPAEIPVAGDPGSTTGPTYATFTGILDAPPATGGQLISERMSRSGTISRDPELEQFEVRAAYLVDLPMINHQIAEPFWEFMNQADVVYEVGWLQEQQLFPNPFYTTGYPITEAYWSNVEIAGTASDVLIQCFERRCLTYTPSNPPGWQVEAGNIGQHYYQWRYSESTPQVAPKALQASVVVLDPGHDASTGGALGIEYLDTMRLATSTRLALEDAGYIVYLTRPDNSTILMQESHLHPATDGMPHDYVEGYVHASKALEFDPQLFISLHFNGSENPFQAGLTIYFSPTGGDQNERLSMLVRDELTAELQANGYDPPSASSSPDTTAGKSYGGFATLGNVYSAPQIWVENRMFGIPAVLIEPLFETNPVERTLIQDEQIIEAIAAALARSVDRLLIDWPIEANEGTTARTNR